ncbi:MAG: phosphatase PAP2 family protein [Chlorobi bacterium]|nr:phosphatase PAP2 family protein [Chlorobiota bacterium]
MLHFLQQADTTLFLFLNGLHSDYLDRVMFLISGKKEWIPLYIAIIILIIVKFKKKGLLAIFALIILLVLTDFVSVHLFKNVFQRLRPSHNPELAGIVHIVNNYKGGMYGFVSSHAANSFGFATFLVLLFKNKYFSGFMLAWATIVSYSRIYLGVHYPGDIICGAVLGILLSFGIFYLYQLSVKKYFQPK